MAGTVGSEVGAIQRCVSPALARYCMQAVYLVILISRRRVGPKSAGICLGKYLSRDMDQVDHDSRHRCLFLRCGILTMPIDIVRDDHS